MCFFACRRCNTVNNKNLWMQWKKIHAHTHRCSTVYVCVCVQRAQVKCRVALEAVRVERAGSKQQLCVCHTVVCIERRGTALPCCACAYRCCQRGIVWEQTATAFKQQPHQACPLFQLTPTVLTAKHRYYTTKRGERGNLRWHSCHWFQCIAFLGKLAKYTKLYWN